MSVTTPVASHTPEAASGAPVGLRRPGMTSVALVLAIIGARVAGGRKYLEQPVRLRI